MSDLLVAVLGCGAKVDAELITFLSIHAWRVDQDGYVVAGIGGVRVRLHNLVYGTVPPGLVIDHKDRDPLNNLRSNLRAVHYSMQNYNQGKRPSHTGHRGIAKLSNGKFQAQIYKDKRRMKQCFLTLEEALTWRYNKEIELYGEASK